MFEGARQYRLEKMLSFFLLLSLIFTFTVASAKPISELPSYSPEKTGHPKIQSNLFRQIPNHSISAFTESLETTDTGSKEIRLIIELYEENEKYLPILTRNGAQIEKTYKNLVQVIIHPDNILRIAEEEFVKYIRYPYKAYTDTISEGVGVINADYLQDISINGSGVKVAILDLGFLGYTNLIGTDLPSNLITASFRSEGIEAGENHGTACAEIVHDIAPDAQLYLVNFDTSIDLNEAIDWLILQEVDVISFSIAYFNAGPGDGTGIICDIINKAQSNDILFVVSSGNYGEKHYQGTFSDPDNDQWHNVDGDSEVIDITVSAGDTLSLYLSWSASWPTYEDYDLSLYDSDMNEVDYSENMQSSGYDPIESIHYYVPSTETFRVAIKEYSTSESHILELFSSHKLDNNAVSLGSLAIPGDAVGAFTVGATNWVNDEVEEYSSQGPTTDGRIKPDITAPSSVTTSTLNPFRGTSASAPCVAGAAALLLQDKSLTVSQIKDALENTAIDLGSPGKDNVYGSGRLDVLEARIFHNEKPTTVITSPNNGEWHTNNIRLEGESSDVDGTCTNLEVDYNKYTDVPADDRWNYFGLYSLSSDSWYTDINSSAVTSTTFYFRVRTFDGLEWGEWDTNDIAIGIDNTPPEAPTLSEDHSGVSWSSHNTPNYSWNTPTDVGSGIQRYEIKIDETATNQSIATYHPTLSEGIHTCQVRAIDNLDNVGTWSNTITVQIDTIAPTGSISIENDDQYTNSQQVLVVLPSSDPGGSGVTDYSLSLDGETWGPWQSSPSTNTTSISSGDGEKTVYVKYRDQAQLESIPYSDTIILDETKPETVELSSPTNAQIIVDFTPQMSWSSASDTTSGVAGYVLEYDKVNSFDSSDYSQTSTQTISYSPVSDISYGTWYWRVKSIDNAGNVGDWSDIWSFTIAEPYSITVEAYCEVEITTKVVTFSLNESDYDSTITLDNLQLSQDLVAPRTDGGLFHGFKEWKKDGAFFSNEHTIEVSETGTYQIVFEEKTPSLVLQSQEEYFSHILNYECVVWSDQAYSGASVSLTLSEGAVEKHSSSVLVDLVEGENIVTVSVDTIRSLEVGYISGVVLVADVVVMDSSEAILYQDSSSVGVLACPRSVAWDRVIDIVGNWGSYTSEERAEMWQEVVIAIVSNWGSFSAG
jgi:hypothetical protein